jgi:hypothetical protein
MKQSLTQMAESIKNGRAMAAQSAAERIALTRSQKEQSILESFKSTFYDYIPMIEEEGIVISAHFHSAYDYKGSYVKFSKAGVELRMDYNDALSYRYEYNNPDRNSIGTSILATWPKEDLILYIYDKLLYRINNPEN